MTAGKVIYAQHSGVSVSALGRTPTAAGEPGGSLGWPAQVQRRRLLLVAGGLLSIAAGLVLLELRLLGAGTVAWATGLALVVWGAWSRAAADSPVAAPTRSELLAVASIVGVGLVLRLWALEQFPSGIHVDEAAMGLVALDVLRGQGPYPFGFAFIGDPAPFMYAEALLMSIFGVSVGSARILAGLAGAAGLLSLWLLARQLFGVGVALLATALLAFTAAHIHFSRMALNVIEIPLFGVLAVALVWLGVQQQRPVWHLLAGMALGFSQYANFGARAYVLSTGAVYGLLLIRRPRSWRSTLLGGLLALAGMLLVLGPQIAFVRDDPSALVDRLRFRSVFRRWDQAVDIHGTDDPVGVLVGQLALNLLAFISQVDRGPFFNFAQQPLLPGPLAALFVVGLAIALVRVWDPRYATLLLICAGVLSAGVLSAGAPQFHRLLPMLPIACLLAALVVWDILGLAVRRLGGRGPRIVSAVRVAVLALLVLWVAADGLLGVFGRQPAAAPWQPQTAWARWAGEQSRAQTVLLAGGSDVFAWDERVRLLSAGGTVLDVANPTVDLTAALARREPFVLAVNPRLDDWLPLLSYQLPGITFEPVSDSRGLLLLAANVPAALPPPAEQHGLRGVLTVDETDAVTTRDDATLAFRESSRLTDREPFHATWAGTLLVERGGQHRLELYTDGGGELLVDGKTVVEGKASPNPRSLRADLNLTAGPHAIEVRYTYVRGPGTLELRWQPPGGQRTLIPPSALRPT